MNSSDAGRSDAGVADSGTVDAGSAEPGSETAKVSLDASRSLFNVFVETDDPIQCGDSALISNANYIHMSFWPGVANFEANDFAGEYEVCRSNMGDRRCAWGTIVRDRMVDVMTTSVAQDIVVESQSETTLTGRFSRDGAVVRFEASYCDR